MFLKIVFLKFLVLYLLSESHGFLRQKKACKLLAICHAIEKADGDRLPLEIIKSIRERKERVRQQILQIQRQRALRAEEERLKWRQKAASFCETPEIKINKVLGCNSLQLSEQNNYPFSSELNKFCVALIQIANNDVDNIINKIDECERNTQSRKILNKFEQLRQSLSEHCRLEQQQKSALKRAKYYDEVARNLIQEANRLGQLIENNIRIASDNNVEVDLSEKEIEHLLKILEQKDEEPEEQEQDQDQVQESNNLNDLVDIISRQVELEKKQKLQNVRNKLCDKNKKIPCGKNPTFELSQGEIKKLIDFLENEEEAPAPRRSNVNLKDLVDIIKREVKSNAESAEDLQKECIKKKKSECIPKVLLELSEDDLANLLKLLRSKNENDNNKSKKSKSRVQEESSEEEKPKKKRPSKIVNSDEEDEERPKKSRKVKKPKRLQNSEEEEPAKKKNGRGGVHVDANAHAHVSF